MEAKYNLIWVAMICITIIEVVALFNGINGRLMSTSLMLIAGLAGWVLPQLKVKKEEGLWVGLQKK